MLLSNYNELSRKLITQTEGSEVPPFDFVDQPRLIKTQSIEQQKDTIF